MGIGTDSLRHRPPARVFRNLGRWLSKHQYPSTGQDPIIGRDCPLEADVLGIKGMTVFTDHSDGEGFRCHVCLDLSYDLEAAIAHRALHFQH